MRLLRDLAAIPPQSRGKLHQTEHAPTRFGVVITQIYEVLVSEFVRLLHSTGTSGRSQKRRRRSLLSLESIIHFR